MMEFDGAMIGQNSQVRHIPGQLPDLRPTDQEVMLIHVSPNESGLLRDWVGAEDGTVVIDPPAEDAGSYDSDPTLRQGSIMNAEGEQVKRFAFRAERAGAISRATASALGWLAGESVAPRGWLSGRVHPLEDQ